MLHTHKVAGSNPAGNRNFFHLLRSLVRSFCGLHIIISIIMSWTITADKFCVMCRFYNMYMLRFYGVMVSTLDFESSDPSSNLGRTYLFSTLIIMTPWRNGSASDSRSEGCVFESRRGQNLFPTIWLWHFCPKSMPPMRIELMTFGLQDQRSATEL